MITPSAAGGPGTGTETGKGTGTGTGPETGMGTGTGRGTQTAPAAVAPKNFAPEPRTAPDASIPLMRPAYGTNGLTDLRLTDALGLLADLGYDGVALTLDHMHLDPCAPDLAARTARVAARCAGLGLAVAVETGARYVLDPYRKHHPTLLDLDPAARAARVGLLLTAVDVATDLGATAVHCFSGARPPGEHGAPEAPDQTEPPDQPEPADQPDSPEPRGATATAGAVGDARDDPTWRRLADSLAPVLEAATEAGVPLAVEPEPGHLLSDLAGFHRLRSLLGSPDALGLTLDIGHCQCLEPASPAACVRAVAPWVRHVQIEDMRRGVHEHLPLGEGEIDFPPVLEALADLGRAPVPGGTTGGVGYRGLVSVELPRHSHAGPELARTSLSFLRAHQPATFPAPSQAFSRPSSRATSPRSRHLAPPPAGPTAEPTVEPAADPTGGARC